jgi:uncharacterized SAM-binding protein YcdF (DUF218 family)
MFYFLSKVVGWIINPLHLGMTLLAIALGLRLLKRRPRTRKWLVIVACAEMWIFSLRLVSEPLTWGLEHRFARAPELARDPAAIVLLCGMTRVPARGEYELTDAGDRLVEAVRLAHLYTNATVIISGAYIDDYGSDYSEAKTLQKLMTEMGVDPDRIHVDDRSRNTLENARETRRILGDSITSPNHGPILLVTSAMHMPRANGCFVKAGVDVVPWPVDYRMRSLGLRGLFPGIDDMSHSNDALHEYFGLLAYRLNGYL